MLDSSMFSQNPTPRIEQLRRELVGMLRTGRQMFDAAADVLLSGGDVSVVAESIYTSDARINEAERKLRRELVIHGTVFGTNAIPGILVLMSLVKDAERIGEYAKEIHGLGRDGAVMPSDAAARDRLTELKTGVSELVGRCIDLFESQDEAASTAFLEDCRKLQTRCDQATAALLGAEGRNTAGEALLVRALRSVARHAGNVVTSIVMPLDKLDFLPGQPESEQ